MLIMNPAETWLDLRIAGGLSTPENHSAPITPGNDMQGPWKAFFKPLSVRASLKSVLPGSLLRAKSGWCHSSPHREGGFDAARGAFPAGGIDYLNALYPRVAFLRLFTPTDL